MNVRDDSVRVAEAHRQAEVITHRINGQMGLINAPLGERQLEIQRQVAEALLDIWQNDMDQSQLRDTVEVACQCAPCRAFAGRS